MRKARSFSECKLFIVRRSGRRKSNLEKTSPSFGRLSARSDRNVLIKSSCSFSTATMLEMPARSEKVKS